MEEFFAEPFGIQNIDWASLPLRIGLGAIFIHAGFGKWRRGIRGTGDWFRGLGFPMPYLMAPALATTELTGGLLLLMGLVTSWVAIPLALNMVVAVYVNRFKEGLKFSGSSNAQGYELDVLMIMALVALILLGAGPLSLDSLYR